MNHAYKNKYGRLEFEVVGAYQDVSQLKSREFDSSCFFSIDEAEKVALITSNHGIQLGFAAWDKSKAYFIHHQSANVAAVCRIISLDFDSTVNATQELDRPNLYWQGFVAGRL